MPGWRGNIGVIACSMENISERQYYRVLPDGVVAHFVRISRLKPAEVSLEEMIMGDRLKQCAQLVADAKPDLIVFADHSWSFERGVGWDRQVAKRIEDETGIPSITMSTSILEALKSLKISKVAAVGPWNDAKVSKLKEFHSGHGIEIVNYRFVPPDTLLCAPDEAYYQILRQTDVDTAQGLLACFSGERSLDVVEALEKDLQKPVVGAVQATIWYALQKMQVREPLLGHGLLFRTPLLRE